MVGLGFGDDFSLWPNEDTRIHFSREFAGQGHDQAKQVTTEEEMKTLVLTWSQTQHDGVRRRRLEERFDREYANNITWDEFSNLFESTLKIIGSNVQQEVKLNHENTSSSSASKKASAAARAIKTEEQMQLWACVDMMIQSKTIIKRKNKMLGSKSIFA